MSRNASGTYTLPPGNPVVSGTPIASSWANTTLSDLAAEVTDSLSRSGKGGMLTAFKIADGSAAAPGLAFTSETGSGLFRAAAGNVQLSVLGVARAMFTAAGLAVTGAVDATASSSIDGGGEVLKLKPGASDNVYIGFYADTAAPTVRSGFIGYSAPGDPTVYWYNQMADGGTVVQGNKAAGSVGADISLNTTTIRTAGNILSVQNAGSEKVRIDFNGTLAFSSATSGGIVHQGADSGLALRGSRNAGSSTEDVLISSVNTRTAGSLLQVNNNGTERFRVGYDGKIYKNGVEFTGGGATYAWATADQTIQGSTPVSVTNMSFPVAANKTYKFWITGFADRTVGTANMSAQITGPATPTYVGFYIKSTQNTAADTDRVTTGFSSGLNLLGAVGDYYWHFVGQVVNGANAGTVQLQITAGASAPDTVVVKKGMTLRWVEMP